MSGTHVEARIGETAPGPHVLHVIDRRTAARLGRMARQTLLGLADAGVRVSLLTDDAGVAHDCLPAAATPVVFETFDRWRFPPLSWRLAEAFEDDPPDMLHIWETRLAARLAAWARRIDAPVLIHAFSAVDVRFLARIGRHADRHVAGASEYLCTALRERRPTSHYPIQLFAPALLAPDDPPASRRKGHIAGVLAAFCEEDSREAVAGLLAALARVREQGVAMQTVVVVPAGMEHGVRSLIRGTKLGECTSVSSDAAVWDSAMSGVDALIVPSRRVSVDAAALLAMAMRKAVLAANDQVSAWFMPEVTCWTYPAGDDAGLAGLLTRVHSQPEAALALGESARRYVSERHRVSALTADLARFYATIGFPRKTLRLAPGDAPSGVMRR